MAGLDQAGRIVEIARTKSSSVAWYVGNPRIRAGISSFAALADPAEVEDGCRRLAIDVESGRISEILASYRHDQGDYLFVAAEKRRRSPFDVRPENSGQ